MQKFLQIKNNLNYDDKSGGIGGRTVSYDAKTVAAIHKHLGQFQL